MKRLLVIGPLLLFIGCATEPRSVAPAAANTTDPEPLRVVKEHIAAWNAHDIPALLALSRPDVTWYGVAGDTLAPEIEGREQLRDWLAGYFESLPSARSEIEQAVAHGSLVAVRERARWTTDDGEKTQAALAVYEVAEGAVRRVWYFSAQ